MPGNNTYGVVRPATINITNDVDIWYNYKPNRNITGSEYDNFKKIENPTTILSQSKMNNFEISDKRLPGMYNLNLPSTIFSNVGFYTLYIKPKEIICDIKDVGALTAYPDVRGIILDSNSSDMSTNRALLQNDNLKGYRIEYFEYGDNGLERQEYYRLITSNYLCEPVSQNLTTSNVTSNGYRYNESGSLCFITLSPSTSPGFRPNSKPYIGVPNQKISISNTKFDPVCIEINMVEHDIETLSIMAEGEQMRNFENGRITTLNFNGEIYKQYEYATIKNNYTSSNVVEIKVNKKDNIDNSLNFNELKNS